MRKLAKWLGIVVGILVLLVVGAALILPMVISIDTVKGEIVAQVKSATGRDLTIDGPLSLSILPSPAISASKVALSNAPGAAKPMVTLGKLEVQVQLLPLLSKTIVVDRFVLVDPVIDLEVDKQGRGNWNFTPAGGTGAAPQQPAAAGGGGAAGALGSIRLGDVRLENGTVNYTDQRSDEHKTVDKINMTVSLPSLDSPLKADGSARFNAVVLNLKLDVAKAGDLIGAAGSDTTASLTSELVTFDFKGKASAASTSGSGTINLKVPSLRKLAAWLGHPLAGERLKTGEISIVGKLAASSSEIKFTEAQLSFDAIKGKGDLTVNTGGARPSIKGDLDLAALDLNPYLAPEGQGGGGAGGGGGGASSGWSDERIDVAGLKTADVDFKIAANAIKYRKIHVEKSAMTVRVNNGRMDVELTDLAAYQGGGKASVVLDGGANPMAVTLNANLTGVQMEPLLSDAMSLDKLTGKGNITVALTSKGQSQRALVSALNGKGNMNIADGQIKGMDLLKMLNSATSAVGNVLSGGGGGETKFSHLTGTFTVTNGIVHNNDLVLDSPGLKAEGAGTIDLPQRRVDYKVTPKVAGLNVPVNVQGPWDNLSYVPDIAGIVKGGVGGAVDTLKGAVPGMPGGGSGGKSSGGGLPLPNPFK
ncbi:MAG TPA: AsmA family protein [Stellaceae bacterium]|nr:AsmA family protein [Stellaceae bacterium]